MRSAMTGPGDAKISKTWFLSLKNILLQSTNQKGKEKVRTIRQ